MENLSIFDPPRGGTPHSGGQLGSTPGAPPGPPQLPPQMFTTAAQLLDLTDSEVLPPCLPQNHHHTALSHRIDSGGALFTGTSLRK